MKNGKSALAVFGLVAAAAFALPAAAQSTSAFYLGGSIGASKFQNGCLGGTTRCESRDTGWRVLAGYQIDRNFAIEGGYHDLGKISDTGANASSSAWELVGIGAVPVVGPLSLYGKFGIFRGEMKAGGIKEMNTSATFGGGLQYDFTRQFGARAEWQRYNNLGNASTIVETNVDTVSLGLVYKFY